MTSQLWSFISLFSPLLFVVVVGIIGRVTRPAASRLIERHRDSEKRIVSNADKAYSFRLSQLPPRIKIQEAASSAD